MKKWMLFGMLAAMTLVQGCGYNRLVSLQQEVEKQWAQVKSRQNGPSLKAACAPAIFRLVLSLRGGFRCFSSK